MKTHSITRRLVVMVLLVELIAAVCVTGAALVYEHHTHFRAFDIMLRGRADSLLGAVQDADDAQDNVMLDGTEVNISPRDLYQVKDSAGRIIGRSQNLNGIGELTSRDRSVIFEMPLRGRTYRVIHIDGLRIVDPGDKSGGIKRYISIYYGSPVGRAWEAVFSAVTFYAISSLLVLAITGVLMSWLLSRSLAPLRELAGAASSVSATSWSFHPPAAARETRELAPLISTIETVLQRLERSFEVQKRFVGDAAHELKTAVAVVKSSLQLLGMKQRTASEYQAGLERSLNDCQRMEAIVNQMLMLARIEEEKPDETRAVISNVSDVILKVFYDLAPVASSRNVRLQHDSKGPVLCALDADQCDLLCSNLIMNALQHSVEESVVTVDIHCNRHFAELKFIDQGEGIDPRDMSRIFERFWRGDPSRSRNTGGTGLGLSICKAIVEQNRGHIEISSQLNGGTTVIVRLPLVEQYGSRVDKA